MVDPIKYLEWSRPDQKMSYIILYRDPNFYPDFQDRAFRDRADLLDKEMKEGQVSLVLRNTSAADSGVYECRVVQVVRNRQKRSVLIAEPNMVIKLRVSPECESGPNASHLMPAALFSLLTLICRSNPRRRWRRCCCCRRRRRLAGPQEKPGRRWR